MVIIFPFQIKNNQAIKIVLKPSEVHKKIHIQHHKPYIFVQSRDTVSLKDKY